VGFEPIRLERQRDAMCPGIPVGTSHAPKGCGVPTGNRTLVERGICEGVQGRLNGGAWSPPGFAQRVASAFVDLAA